MCLRFLRHGETEALGIKQNQLEALRGGFKLGRGARERGRLLMQNIKSRRKRYEACDDVVRVTGVEPARLATREPKSRMSANSIIPAYSFLMIAYGGG